MTGDLADAKPTGRSHAAGMQALIVDDHEFARAACRALLESEGVTVLADLPIGDRALAAAAALAPDVILVDVGLGDRRALALAERLGLAAAVVLTSSAGRGRLGAVVAGFPFVEKLEISAARLDPASAPVRARACGPTVAQHD